MAVLRATLEPWVPLLDRDTLEGLRAEVVAALGASVAGPAQPLMTDSTSAASNGFA